MDSPLVPALAALAGALIGSLASIVGTIVQARSQRRLELSRLAVQAAVEEQKRHFEHLHASAQGRPFSMPPLTAYLALHSQIVRAIDGGNLTPERLARIKKEYAEITAVLAKAAE